MTTKTSDTNPTDNDPDLSPTEIFSLLSNERRRYALHYLSSRVGAIPIGEVAEQIAIWEGDPTMDRYQRVYVGLIHNHLSRLGHAGVIAYDSDEELITTTDGIDAVRPYLELAACVDMSRLNG
ncbi:DUF7344 domain-containing protein [Haloprofundus halobius]|uniref:DUF7344 domain-containing protein n=1 Tax=Haloprofundus halobius TaxID=2876194 RepID=UPI001CCA970B|nr:hypothetical protein [Haloprofundus halobius]